MSFTGSRDKDQPAEMAPNKIMGPVVKTPDVSIDSDDVNEEPAQETEPFPVKPDDKEQVENDVENESEGPRDRARHLPIDRGWAWVVLFAGMFYLSLMGGIRKNLGIFFVSFQNRFNSSAALTSSLTLTQSLVTSVGSLIVMTIGMQYMDNRLSIMIGSCLMTVSCLISAFATEITLLYLSFGFLEGLGVSMIHAPVTAAIGEYFEKKRGFANGIAYSAASFGGLIFAPIITALFNYYGYSGTMMLVGGMAFNMMISGALMRPMSFYEKSKTESEKQELTSETNHCVQSEKVVTSKEDIPISVNSASTKNNGFHNVNGPPKKQFLDECSADKPCNPALSKVKGHLTPRLVIRSDSHDPSLIKDKSGATSPLIFRHRASSVGARHRTVSETSRTSNPLNHIVESLSRSKVALYASTEFVYGSVVSIKEITPHEYESDSETKSKSLCSRIKKSIYEAFHVLFDKSLLRNHVFQLFLIMAFMVAPSNVFLCVSLAPHANDMGVSSNDIGIMMSVLSGCGTGSRVLTALSADRSFVNLTTLLACASIFVGIFANCVRLFQTYVALVVFAGVLGFCCEIYQAIYAVILVDYLTLSKLKSCIGFAMLIHGASFAVVFQLVGVMRDATGTYYLSFHVLGAMEIIGALLALSLPIVHRRYNLKNKGLTVTV